MHGPFAEYLDKYNFLYNHVREDAYRLLTKSIINGTVEIEFDDTSKQLLLNLENYQDYSERNEKGVRYLFDFAFYNGSYYCYYGIVPVLTVLLPIALIFGVCLSSNIICIVYSFMCIILLQRIYKKLMEKYNINLKFSTEIIGFLALFLATGLFVLMGSANFYQAADLCGIAWGLFAAYLLLLLDNNNRTKLKLFFIGLFFGLMVCSRPIFVLYIIPILISIFKYIIHDKKFEIKRAIAFVVPIIIIAIAQMYYNYIRFDNVFEFGQFYNLTINNTADQKMDLGRAIEGTIAYLVNPSEFTMQFPFIEPKKPIVMNGNNIYAETVLGLIWFSYLWIFFFSRKIIKTSKSKTLKWISISLLILTIIMCSVNTCLAGMNQRYLIDIQPALAILACIMWFIYIKNNNENETYSKNDFFEFIIKLSIIIAIPIVLNKIDYNTLENFSDDYTKIGKLQYYIEKAIYFYR